ncbi:hypothetical protein QR680_011138 [Steinernema hermaphroditum]|uniref:Uncharacterized protein n=1 Tax=Steinernema hermaphroditum TaxID=289476 RepID=A0AA39MCU9_9BILA|nr:hypothetical protein QR680_011138 [Steinernema hermaphroditum]
MDTETLCVLLNEANRRNAKLLTENEKLRCTIERQNECMSRVHATMDALVQKADFPQQCGYFRSFHDEHRMANEALLEEIEVLGRRMSRSFNLAYKQILNLREENTKLRETTRKDLEDHTKIVKALKMALKRKEEIIKQHERVQDELRRHCDHVLLDEEYEEALFQSSVQHNTAFLMADGLIAGRLDGSYLSREAREDIMRHLERILNAYRYGN